jgi:hypothetical protein
VVTSTAVVIVGGRSVLQLNGSLLTNVSGDITIMAGNTPCPVQTVAANGGSVTCVLPDLAAGPAEITLVVAGAGAATMPTGGDLLIYTVPLATSLPVTAPKASMFGGIELVVNGSGFAPDSDSKTQVSVSVSGAAPGPVKPVLAGSSLTQATIRLPMFVATSTAPVFQLNLQLRVFATSSNTTLGTVAVPVTLDRTFTPAISSISPRDIQPYAVNNNLTFTWRVSSTAAAAAGLTNATDASAASLAAVSLQTTLGVRRFSCSNTTVLASNMTAANYSETVTCILSPDMPAASYNLWVCLPAIGCGYVPASVRANASVTGISAVAGSTAGGTQLVITGIGELK